MTQIPGVIENLLSVSRSKSSMVAFWQQLGDTRIDLSMRELDFRIPFEFRSYRDSDAQYMATPVVGYIQGKSDAHIAQTINDRTRNFTEESFWARGYFVSTVGRDEDVDPKSYSETGY